MQPACRGHNRSKTMILDEIVPMSPFAELIMAMIKANTIPEYHDKLDKLRNMLAEYPKLSTRRRLSPSKSYIKVIKNNQGFIGTVIQCPWSKQTAQYDLIHIEPSSKLPVRIISSWSQPISNNKFTRMFFDIYEIPIEIPTELTALILHGKINQR